MVVNHAHANVPDVEPQLQAGILTHATCAVAASAAFGRSRFGHTQSWIVDPRFIIQEMVSRDILSKALKLAERLAPNVSVSPSTGFRLDSTGGDLKIAIRCWQNGFRHHELKRNRVQMERQRATPQVRDMVNGQKLPPQRVQPSWLHVSNCARLPPKCLPLLRWNHRCWLLAAPAFHLDSWSAENGTGCVVGGHDADILENKRLSILQWVIARANECTALHPAAAALRLGATLLFGLSPDSASAFTPMIVTAHARQLLCGVRSTQTQMR